MAMRRARSMTDILDPPAEASGQTFAWDWIDDLAQERGLGPISIEDRQAHLALRRSRGCVDDGVAVRLPLDQIAIGERRRRLGKIDDLAESIQSLGLLNPITVVA